ncbi:tRNA pseudouridine synthase [Paramicrosporidium saccamoebae]|uniref:tRNA pseudouridine synthase n=1 Tax=Paramicrosporidium saccamoebae TaxID=1246581 RepID=A0A2H9TPM0_9FUNG|nr:tRNA pseudouridine synthase [Paramicrosporidium saccamoebae]
MMVSIYSRIKESTLRHICLDSTSGYWGRHLILPYPTLPYFRLRALRVLGSYMKRRALLDTDYSKWTHEQLIQRIYSLEGKSVKKSKPQRPLDFSQYPTKRIALKIAYFGWEYNGFASQMSYKPDGAESTRNPTVVTVEDLLFAALMRTRLIESPKTCQYSRCGRTDAGVSATGQVVAVTIRSSGQKHETDELEVPVCTMLNRLLPDDIRVLGWSPIPSTFDARFSCRGRRYKYFFHGLGLDLTRMEEAAAKLVGEHDFRNFCRIDKAVNSFTRRIFSSTIRKLDNEMYEYEIHGSAFLYHQVRCTMEILFLVGRGIEPPEVVDHLLDISKCSDPPQYDIASEIPLVLSECYYDENLSFCIDEPEGRRLSSEIFTFWRDAQAKAMTVAMLRSGNEQTDPFHGKSTRSRILHK